MSGHISSRLARWRQIFRKKEKSWKTNEKTRLRVIEPQLEDQLLEAEFENLSSKLSTLCISQDFVSEMREAFYLFDKVFIIYYFSIIDDFSLCCNVTGPERLYLL